MKPRSPVNPNSVVSQTGLAASMDTDLGQPGFGRRQFLELVGGGTAAAVAATLGLPALPGAEVAAAQSAPGSGNSRRDMAYRIRHDAAMHRYTLAAAEHPTNGDEERYPGHNVSHGKNLPHNDLGEADPEAFDTLVAAMRSGVPANFGSIPRGGNAAPAFLAEALAYVLEGSDSHELTMAPPPRFDSEEMAAEMVEVYWQALTRDVPYAAYGEEPMTRGAIADLRRFSLFADLTAETLFRGPSLGETDGPYVSQFLLRDIPFGAQRVSQVVRVPMPAIDYMTDWTTWLAVQNGQGPGASLSFDPTPRYIRNGRDLGEWVRIDFACQCGWSAALILAGLASARARSLPFAVNPLDLLGRVAGPATKASAHQKWAVHRSLRPEELGGRVHNHLTGAASYPIHEKLLGSSALSEVFSRFGTYLLPMAYPVGSPPHPSYPAMHAVIAGAGITALKAVYDQDAVIPNPVVASEDGLELLPYEGSPLTVGGELNKLGANVAFGRDAAGVHFRSDGVAGLKLGEDVAIAILKDIHETYGLPFAGFTFTKFDGTVVTA